MQHLKIIVKEIEDLTPAEPEILSYEELEFKTMVILEKGTTGGQTSLSFRLDGADGKHYLAQMTGNIFDTATGAFRGADYRFKRKN